MRPASLRHASGILIAVAVAVLALAGCSSDDSAPSGGTDHNEADVAFATEMIQHHAQALEMVDLTLGRALDPEVAALAEDIRAAQAPEIETMVGWLTDWDEEVPETSRDHANAHGDGMEMDSELPGMMSSEEMDALDEASDAEFEELWLEMMTEHHEGAVEMARTEQEDGAYEPAIELAEQIEQGQTEEIDLMRKLVP